MNNNEVFKKLQMLLNVDDSKLVDIFALSDVNVTPKEIHSWAKSLDEEASVALDDKMLATFLNALIYLKRGKEEKDSSRPLELPVTNNIILKKIRIAFQLEEKDFIALNEKAKSATSPKEWGYYFRSPSHKNYRECPDSFLLSVLEGLK